MAWSEIQKAINTNINEALDVLTKRLIGVNTDVSDTTVFGKLNEKVRPYKQLKLNKVTSPICTASNQPKGVMVDYNSQYYLIVSDTILWKIRKSDDVIVGSINFSGITLKSIPIVINDFAFILQLGLYMVVCVDLNSMTYKQFQPPTTSSGSITVASVKNQHFDVRYVSGNQYQCLIWVDGATNDGIIVCTLDTTATSGATMAHVSFSNIGISPTTANTACCFGLGNDIHYYTTSSSVEPTLTIRNYVISDGVYDYSIDIPNHKHIDTNSFRAFQTKDFLFFRTVNISASQRSDICSFKKSNGEFKFLGIANYFNSPFYTMYPLQQKNENYCVLLSFGQIYIIRNDETFDEIIKSQRDITNVDFQGNAYVGGTVSEAPFSYDDNNKKISISSGCHFTTTTLTNFNSFAIREYDIV